MFDVGGGEFIVILLAILIFFGPRKIPEIARAIGKGLSHLRRAQAEFERNIKGISTEIESATSIEESKPSPGRKAPGKASTSDPPGAVSTETQADAAQERSTQSDDTIPTVDQNTEDAADSNGTNAPKYAARPAAGAVPRNNDSAAKHETPPAPSEEGSPGQP